MPPSAPICQKSEPLRSRFRIRALQPFKIRKRYMRGSTSRIWPDLAVDQHDVAEILADPSHSFDVARWVKELSVSAELAILDHERNFVRSARNADRVGFYPGVVLVAKNVGSGQSCKDVEARRAQTVIVEPEKRRRHLRQLIAVVDHLRVARAEPVWRNCGVTVAVSINEAAVQMRHHAHVISKRSQTRIDWNPVRVKFRKVTGVADIERCATLR